MRVVLVGAGGQAREQAWVARALGHEVVGFVVSDPTRKGAHDSPSIGDLGWLRGDGWDAVAIAIGTPRVRLKLAAELAPVVGDRWISLVHPSVPYDRETCRIGVGAYVGPGAVLTVGVDVGDHAMVNFGATVGHETRIGRGCVVNPGANLSGGVVLGDGVLVGTGAQILQYRVVGDFATVGAGAVVTRDVLPGVTVIGVPARERA